MVANLHQQIHVGTAHTDATQSSLQAVVISSAKPSGLFFARFSISTSP
jgi:hypothetical protein